MISVDTNVLVRILVDDEKQKNQVKLARQFAKKHETFFIVQLVQVELVWVLDYSYKLNKSEIIPILEHLLNNDAFVLQHEEHFSQALTLYQTNNCGFPDCLIQVESSKENCETITFDKKFAKLSKVKLLDN